MYTKKDLESNNNQGSAEVTQMPLSTSNVGLKRRRQSFQNDESTLSDGSCYDDDLTSKQQSICLQFSIDQIIEKSFSKHLESTIVPGSDDHKISLESSSRIN